MADDINILSKLDHVGLFTGHDDLRSPYSVWCSSENNFGDRFVFGLGEEGGESGFCAVGAMIGRIDSLSAVNAPTPHSDYWKICDGLTISGGRWDTKVTPNLDEKFIRSTTGVTGGTGGSASHSHTVAQRPTTEMDGVPAGVGFNLHLLSDQNDLSSDTQNHLPPYYEVEFWVRKDRV